MKIYSISAPTIPRYLTKDLEVGTRVAHVNAEGVTKLGVVVARNRVLYDRNMTEFWGRKNLTTATYYVPDRMHYVVKAYLNYKKPYSHSTRGQLVRPSFLSDEELTLPRGVKLTTSSPLEIFTSTRPIRRTGQMFLLSMWCWAEAYVFGGRMEPPSIIMRTRDHRLGMYINNAAGATAILISEALNHPRTIFKVMLHEMIHQHNYEVEGFRAGATGDELARLAHGEIFTKWIPHVKNKTGIQTQITDKADNPFKIQIQEGLLHSSIHRLGTSGRYW